MAHIVSFVPPDSSAEIINDHVFQEYRKTSIADWNEIINLGLDVLSWWEEIVKPGIGKLAIVRCKQVKKEKSGKLNLLSISTSISG